MTVPARRSAIPTTAPGAVVGIDAGPRTEREAEHLALHLSDALRERGTTVDWACTHRVVHAGVPRVALSLAGTSQLPSALRLLDPDLALWTSDDREDDGPACAAALAYRRHAEGRAVRFPGHVDLVGSVCLVDVIQNSAIERIALLGGGHVDPQTVLHTRDFVRPRFVDGELTLHVQRARGNALVPFETPNPTPCCADH